MINCNPETVSTDYDTADRLYFQPLTFEDVMAVIETERSARRRGVVPRAVRRPDAAEAGARAAGGRRAGFSARRPIRSISPRIGKRFAALLASLDITQPASGTATSREEAREVAAAIGFPVVVRPSYVLGGRAMAIVYDVATLDRYMTHAVDASPEHPVLVDKFLEDAFEFDVDAVADATGAVVIGGIMEHIEEAGIHSGDSSCVVPPFICPERHLATIRDYTRRIARALKVVGLMNVQYATKDDVVYVLEVNPRASRTVPYLSKATGVSLAKVAAKVMAGRTLAELGLTERPRGRRRVREEPGVPVRAVPRRRHDPRPGDEVDRRGDGRVERASASRSPRRSSAVGQRLPESGTAFVSVNNDDKANLLPIARDLAELGFHLIATRGTAAYLRAYGLDVDVVYKVNEGPAEHRRRDRQPQGRSDRQHAARPRVVLRRPHRAPRRDDARGAVHHDAHRRRRRGQRHPRAARAGRRRPRAAGLLRRNCRGEGVAARRICVRLGSPRKHENTKGFCDSEVS